MIIEAIKVYFPKLYDFIKLNPALFLASESAFGKYPGVGKHDKASRKVRLEQIFGETSPLAPREMLDLLQEVFPRLESVFGNTHYDEGQTVSWHRAKRLCSSDHFDRYFTYVVARGEISDAHFASVVWHLGEESDEAFAMRLSSEFQEYPLPEVITKLAYWEGQLKLHERQILSRSIARLGERIDANERVFFSLSAQDRAAGFVASLLKNAPQPGSLFEWAKELLQIAQPVEFGLKLYYSITDQRIRNKLVERDNFTTEQLQVLRHVVVSKYVSAAGERGTIFDVLDNYEAGWLLTYWKENRATSESDFPSRYIAGIVEAMDGQELRLLDMFCGYITAFGSETKTFRARFHSDDFKRLAELTDATALCDGLVQKDGDVISVLSPEDKKDTNDFPRQGALSDEKMVALYQWHFQREVDEDNLLTLNETE